MMPYIYFFIILFFLLLYSFFITRQLYKVISLDSAFKVLRPQLLSNSCSQDQLFNSLRLLFNKRLWFDALQLLEYQLSVKPDSEHYYFNAIGVIYKNMQQYDLATLYFLQSLQKSRDYQVALRNLQQLNVKI